MSAKKRKASPVSDIEHIITRLEDCLVQAKASLGTGVNEDLDAVSKLHELAALAAQFTSERHKADRDRLAHVVDTLDREGTALWNIASSISPTPDSLKLPLTAALRLSGYRLIESGSPPKPRIEDLIHLLQLASKTGVTLAEAGKADLASLVLTSAAQYEEKLRKVEDPEENHQHARAKATVAYYCSRMETAWKEGNDGLAEYMLQRITVDDSAHLTHVTAHDREMLASKLLEIGRALLAGDSRSERPIEERANESVAWLQKAFSLADQLEESRTAGLADLKRSILRNLARAYVLSATKHPEHIVRAEASLKELLASVGGSETDYSDSESNGEFQELRWWMVAVLKRRNASDEELSEAFEVIITHMVFSEDNAARLVQETKMLNPRQQYRLAVSILQRCLLRLLASSDDAAPVCMDQIALALIFQCSKSQDQTAALADLRRSFYPFHEADFQLSKTGATACLMLFWQFAHQHFRAKRYPEAAEWYLFGTDDAFGSVTELCHDKCRRKAALCYIEMQDYSRANTVARHCTPESALTQYVLLLIAIRQGAEDEAIQAVRMMVQAADYDRKMLLMATRLAHEADLKALLLSVLEELLNAVRSSKNLQTETEVVTLARCTIRLVVRLMADSTVEGKRDTLVPTLIKHFQTARDAVQFACDQRHSALIIKDISWLWRTAYSCAIQGCGEWENAEDSVPILFDITGELINAYCKVVIQVDEDVYLTTALASFAATSARVYYEVFSMRHLISGAGASYQSQIPMLEKLRREARLCEEAIQGIIEKDVLKTHNLSIALRCLRTVLVFEAELAIYAKDWDNIPGIIESIVGLPTELVDTLEAVADMLWAERNCPFTVLFSALEKILHASLDSHALSIEKFSRWLRAICTMLLSRNTTPDRLKAVAYVEQAVAVLEDHAEHSQVNVETYPVDERHWLLTTAYNTGIDCLHSGLLDEAKRWFEVSTILCRFVPDGEASSRKISDTYTLLLNRYAN